MATVFSRLCAMQITVLLIFQVKPPCLTFPNFFMVRNPKHPVSRVIPGRNLVVQTVCKSCCCKLNFQANATRRTENNNEQQNVIQRRRRSRGDSVKLAITDNFSTDARRLTTESSRDRPRVHYIPGRRSSRTDRSTDPRDMLRHNRTAPLSPGCTDLLPPHILVPSVPPGILVQYHQT